MKRVLSCVLGEGVVSRAERPPEPPSVGTLKPDEGSGPCAWGPWLMLPYKGSGKSRSVNFGCRVETSVTPPSPPQHNWIHLATQSSQVPTHPGSEVIQALPRSTVQGETRVLDGLRPAPLSACWLCWHPECQLLLYLQLQILIPYPAHFLLE